MRERDILIFPKFDNIDKIQEVRKENDRLYGKIMPHITLVFPFCDDISDEELVVKLEKLLNCGKFSVKFKGVTLSHDNYIFLNCVEGTEMLINLHDEIYNNILPQYLRKDISYEPHITLGQGKTVDFLSDFDHEFEAVIDEIVLEEIGENEESIIVKKIKL